MTASKKASTKRVPAKKTAGTPTAATKKTATAEKGAVKKVAPKKAAPAKKASSTTPAEPVDTDPLRLQAETGAPTRFATAAETSASPSASSDPTIPVGAIEQPPEASVLLSPEEASLEPPPRHPDAGRVLDVSALEGTAAARGAVVLDPSTPARPTHPEGERTSRRDV